MLFSRSALLATTAALAARSSSVVTGTAAFTAVPATRLSAGPNQATSIMSQSESRSTRRYNMYSSSSSEVPPINRVQMDVFSDIIDEYESLGREGSGYVVIDVRGEDEVAFTGKVSPNAHTLPLPLIAKEGEDGAFNMDEEEFEETFGFAKPSMDEALVFTCKAGVRSYYGAQYAALAGYSKLFDYIGGADEWFRFPR